MVWVNEMNARTKKNYGGIIMKKLLSLVLALVALTLCMSAAFAEAVDHTQGDPVMIKIAHVSQEGVPIDQGHRLFKQKIEEITGGRITVEVYPAAQLGDNVYLLEQLQFGALEMCSPSVAALGGFTNATALLDMPFLFKNEAAAEEALDGEVGQGMFAELEQFGFKGIAWLSTGWRHLTANDEIRTPDLMKGKKIRVMENQMHIDCWNAMGASATPMAFSELYTALQNGTVDCQENPFANINGNRLHDVQKYVIMTKHIYDTAPLLASKIWWDGLSAADQELIMSTYAETVQLQRQISFDDQETIKKAIGENGTNVVVELTAEEAAAWRTAVQPVYDKYQSTLNQDWLAKIEEINAKY